jgi:hypothetical protein
VTATKFRATLSRLKLSQRGVARLFKVNERTSRRWALGERPVPQDVADQLSQLVAGKITFDQIKVL